MASPCTRCPSQTENARRERCEVAPSGERAERRRRPGGEPRGEERLAGGCRSVREQQRRLRGERDALREVARTQLALGRVAQVHKKRAGVAVVARVASLTRSEQRLERRERARLARECPQHVEAHDVAGALPDGIQRRLAEASCDPRRSRCPRVPPWLPHTPPVLASTPRPPRPTLLPYTTLFRSTPARTSA